MMLKRSVLVFVVLSAWSIRQSESLGASDRSVCLDSSVLRERGLISGGEVAPRDKWPWLVAFVVKADNKFICAGSLISGRFVLTAAHCIQSKGDKHPREPKDVNVHLGKWNLSDATEQDVVLATPTEFIVHHDWNVTDTKWDADIAIARLADDVTFSRSVQPVCLWTSQMQPDQANDGGIVVGWGQTEGDGEYSDIPDEAKVLRLSIGDCNEADGLSQVILRRKLCVRGNREGACSGDDGGGFFTAQGVKWFLRGISSVSRQNVAMECDAIFTNVEEFIPWIDQVIAGDEQMNCGFKDEFYGYTCKWKNSFTHRDTKIFQVGGSHVGSLTNADVSQFSTYFNKKLKFLPISLGRFFPNLDRYIVKSSGLEQISRNNFVDLKKLNFLVITVSPLQVIPVDAFYDLINLEELWLYQNDIEAIDSSTFIHNTKLRKISLQHNKIASLDSSTFRNNLELRWIDFASNLLTLIGPELLTPLEQLREVDFRYNKCIDKDWRSLSSYYILPLSMKEIFKEICASKCK